MTHTEKKDNSLHSHFGADASSKAEDSSFSIWTEKYRPKSFDDVKGQDEIVKRVKAFIEQRNMPHLLFSGPAGVGKTSLSLVIAHQLFGEEWSQNFLELNASDERGIDVVRNNVKDFARTKTMGDFNFKIIYLDECDALTKDAQHALRRTMENYTKTCRFILSCNYSTKIIDPIQSRCAIFRFRPLPKESIFLLIDSIAGREGISIDSKAKEALYIVSNGDCRRLENVMQSCASVSRKITEESVFSIASVARPVELKTAIELSLQGRFLDARKMALDIMLNYGLSGIDMVKQIQKTALELPETDRKKMKMIDKCGEIEFRMVEGSDEFLQIEALLALFGIIGGAADAGGKVTMGKDTRELQDD